MSCYHPVDAWIVGKDPQTGKNILSFSDPSPEFMEKHPELHIQVPCGKCIGCRLDYSHQWANRCMLELQYHDSAWFCTFTYDDFHVPITYHVDSETGEAFPGMSLRKRDWQLLMKRIRKNFPDDKIRFMACGEYGDHTFRPHYHAILFGLHLSDLVLYRQNFEGDSYYNSDSLSRCWLDNDGNPIGYVVVAPVTWKTCAYVARYTMKKAKTAKTVGQDVYQSLGLEPEFILMSRKPGIGRMYYEDHKDDLFKYEYINLSTADKGLKFRPPKYFERVYQEEYPGALDDRKKQRIQTAKETEILKDKQSSLDRYDRLALAERVKAGQIKSLRRIL